jgi:osmotically-inducible protein OsmY
MCYLWEVRKRLYERRKSDGERTGSHRSESRVGGARFNTRTIDHIVYLHGMVSEGLQGREAEAIAQQTPGVARVVNLLAVSK